MFPFSFLSSAFVPTQSMPGWLRVYADHTPMTTVVNSLRGLFDGTPLGSDILTTLAWAATSCASRGPARRSGPGCR